MLLTSLNTNEVKVGSTFPEKDAWNPRFRVDPKVNFITKY